MRKLIYFISFLLMLFISCNNTDKKFVGSWILIEGPPSSNMNPVDISNSGMICSIEKYGDTKKTYNFTFLGDSYILSVKDENTLVLITNPNVCLKYYPETELLFFGKENGTEGFKFKRLDNFNNEKPEQDKSIKTSSEINENKYGENNITILGNKVNIRQTPSTNAKVIFQLSKGDVCSLLEKGNSENIGNKTDYWYKINYADKIGWVFGAFTSISNNLDSICIVNEFALYPFDNNIKNSEMVYFNRKMNISTKTEIKLEKDYHDENIIDTIKTIYWGKSFIKTISNKFNTGALLGVLIKDNNLSLKNNLKIGKTAEEAFNYFKIKFDNTVQYRYLVIKGSEDDETTLTFHFNNNIIDEISYSPYWD